MRVTPQIEIAEDEIEERFVLASGPGGQNVNKVATAVQLRFDAARSASLPADLLPRLAKLAGRRMTQDGVLLSRRAELPLAGTQPRRRPRPARRTYKTGRHRAKAAGADAPHGRQQTAPAARQGRSRRREATAQASRRGVISNLSDRFRSRHPGKASGVIRDRYKCRRP